MYSSLDARSTVRARDATCLQDLPADAPLDERTRCLNHPRHVVSLHAPNRRRRACGDYATSRPSVRNERQTGALRRRADAAARETPNPVRWEARLAETAIARETAARRRRGGPGSLSLSVCLSPLSVDRRRGAPSSSSKRSARVQLCWHITPGAAAAAAALCKESQLPAFPAAGRWPRGAVGPGAGHDGVTGPRDARRRRPFGGAASLGEVRQGRSQAATC